MSARARCEIVLEAIKTPHRCGVCAETAIHIPYSWLEAAFTRLPAWAVVPATIVNHIRCKDAAVRSSIPYPVTGVLGVYLFSGRKIVGRDARRGHAYMDCVDRSATKIVRADSIAKQASYALAGTLLCQAQPDGSLYQTSRVPHTQFLDEILPMRLHGIWADVKPLSDFVGRVFQRDQP